MKPTEIPARVMPGLVTWKNEYGFRCVVWHYQSDPAKRGDWADFTAAGIPGGRASDHWRQEQEIDVYLVRGKPTYYGFSQARNVVDALPCDIASFRQWFWFLSADFGASGDATCWLFWAENPLTGDLFIFDEVYVDDAFGRDERTPEHIKPMIYDRLRHWAGVPSNQPLDFGSWIKYAVGDPSGVPYMQEYRKSPMAIPAHGGNPSAKVKLNDVDAGEERINAYCSASFVCCPTPDNPDGRWYVNRGLCPKCGAERVGRPRLTILRSGAPHLIAQLPTIRKKLARRDGEKPPEGNVRVEDHAEAACRYGAMSRPLSKMPLFPRREDVPLREAQAADQFWRTIQNRVNHHRLATLYDGDPAALAILEKEAYADREEKGGALPW